MFLNKKMREMQEQSWIKWVVATVFSMSVLSTLGQTAIVGQVKDGASKQGLATVSVALKDGGPGVITDSAGYFTLPVNQLPAQVKFSSIGYTTLTRQIKTADTVIIFLQPDTKQLRSVTVTSKKRGKYRNRDNPAVELIRKVIEHKDQNRPGHYDYVSYEQYEKLQVALSKVSNKLTESKLLRKYHFLFENIDSTTLEGKSLIPVFIREKLSDVYRERSPEKTKTVVLGDKQVDFGEFVDNKGVTAFLNRLYEDVDIYENNIPLFTNQFLSPIADIAPTLYRFYIRDTIRDDSGRRFVRMYFSPRNTNDFLFRGEMMITLDSNYAVQKLEMTVSKNINLNFVRQLQVKQDFERTPQGKYNLIKSSMMAEVAASKDKGGGIFGERIVSYKDYKINGPRNPQIFKGPAEVITDSAGSRSDEFWTVRRHDTLTRAERNTYANIDSLQKMPSYRRVLDIATLLLAGYKSFGKFEVGPVNTFYSFNPVEGFRGRLGGRTTPKLSKRLYFETYAAYGFKDEKWKGYLGVTYSLNNKSIYEFPLNYVRVSAQRETKIPGQELQFVQEDNFLLSFKRGNNDKWLYNTYYRVDYVREFQNHLSIGANYKYWQQSPAGTLSYTKSTNGNIADIANLTTSELGFNVRWAPKEQFYQGKVYRIPIVNKYPVFTFNYSRGVKGLFNGEYNYNNFTFRLEKRFYLAQLGYTDAIFEGAYLTGKLPYPLLFIHRANQTYSLQLNSYNLMNFLEFVSDHYASVNLDHHFNGFIFNRIPLIKKLKWREVVSLKVLYGGVRNENNPAKSDQLYTFPTDSRGRLLSYTLDNGPYVEGSVGIANIFKLFRIDLVKRFTYLNHPDVSEWGIRGRFKFDF